MKIIMAEEEVETRNIITMKELKMIVVALDFIMMSNPIPRATFKLAESTKRKVERCINHV